MSEPNHNPKQNRTKNKQKQNNKEPHIYDKKLNGPNRPAE
ncbi:hypothetical protein AJ85_04900 [Alkalihalobacillus alcalophilus ATCC 27647 = CGMCC 1.3604]|uniref:Uncharacterized protein n=1 Tax=Alkalihalobacillus alcalophilus ATCC 27647 = CGMCC 1.3604 TaxID=1218173 RepID=A0A4S4JTE9_ALKAL|nr:hypothetical protein AJ85_04900 [Alkalihalobacillus alcalophilus ATCC 27647 = CGMCC 1.3604]